MSTWSKRDVTELRKRMTEQGRSLHDIANEIRVVTRGSKLAAYRMAAGMSQPDVVEEFLKRAPEAQMDQAWLSRLEAFPLRGSKVPTAAQITVFADVFGAPPLALLDPHALDRMDEHERAVLLRCSSFESPPVVLTAASALPAPSMPTGPELVHGWGFQQRQPPLKDASQEVLEVAARKALRLTALVEGTGVPSQTLAVLREEVTRLTAEYPRQPVTTLLGDLTEIHDVLLQLLQGRSAPRQAAELYLLSGVVSGMLAKASHDLGSPSAARRHAAAAAVCADQIGNNALRAWANGLLSQVAYWARRPLEAVRYAEIGRRAAEGSRGTVTVWLASQHGRALAQAGDGEAALSALGDAETARGLVVADDLDALGGLMKFSQPRQQYYGGDALVWVPGQERRAQDAAAAAVVAYEQADPDEYAFSDHAGAAADLALTLVLGGEIEGAAQALEMVLDLPVAQRIEGVVASVQRVHGALGVPQYRRSQPALDLREQIEMFTRISARSALSVGD
ncbi:hypothetical protein ACIBF1_18590 [Spirillospora sp. NPDC050679]